MLVLYKLITYNDIFQNKSEELKLEVSLFLLKENYYKSFVTKDQMPTAAHNDILQNKSNKIKLEVLFFMLNKYYYQYFCFDGSHANCCTVYTDSETTPLFVLYSRVLRAFGLRIINTVRRN